MHPEFVICSPEITFSKEGYSLVHQCKSFRFWATNNNIFKKNDITVLIYGYVIPRNDYFDKYHSFFQEDLVYTLFQSNRKNFIHKLKGDFLIVIIDDEQLLLFNDRLSVYKFFYYQKGKTFIISNSLKRITEIVPNHIDNLVVAIHSLMQHFISGRTFIKDINYSQPASYVVISNEITFSNYWSSEELVKLNRNRYAIEDFKTLFITSIKNYITYLNPSGISITLTGGRDSRTILSALLSLNISPGTFTFGFPDGSDVTTSRIISERFGLPFSNPYIEDLNAHYYEKLVSEITAYGNSMIHLHRAHRLDAMIKMRKEKPLNDMVFTGVMGGDFIKGAHLDDYIVTELVRHLWKSSFISISKNEIIKELLEKCFHRTELLDVEAIENLISHEPYFRHEDPKVREFYLVYNLIGSLHGTQDIALYNKYYKYCISPFTDLDILYGLFASDYSLFSNFQTSRNPLKRLKGGEFQCSLISQFCNELAEIPFTNRYTPKDLLGNKYLYTLKRIKNYFFLPQLNPTFSYGKWFHPFVSNHLEALHTVPLSELFKTERVLEQFHRSAHLQTEGYWHKYTNLILLKLMTDYFIQS